MPVTFPTPTQIFQRYQTILKGARPDINVLDKSGEALIRGRVTSGLVSGIYADQRLVDNDTFIKDARIEALVRHGTDANILQQPATAATTADFHVTGTIGTPIPAGTSVRYAPTGIIYGVAVASVIDGTGNAHISLAANSQGQITNVDVGETLTFVAPPPGIDPDGVLVLALADGSDPESVDSYRARLLENRQRQPAGGNEFDYPNFAFQASTAVRSALIRRFGRGLGTVDVYITTGTTDIDTAVTQGQAIIRVPSGGVIATVQAYYDANVPLTDCPRVFGPVEVDQDASMKVDLAAGITLATVPADPINNPLNLNVGQLIQREMERAIYKAPVGGRVIPGQPNGYVIASELEQAVDAMLSATIDTNGQAKGKIPVLVDREVGPLDGLNYNRMLVGNQLALPNVMTVTVGV